MERILSKVKDKYSDQQLDETDGIRIDFPEKREWVHLRKSNTEPIIRIIAEAPQESRAVKLADQLMADLKKFS